MVTLLAAEPPLSIPLIMAGIALISSILTAAFQFRNQARLATLSAKLDEQKAETSARRTYEYETRKRLYTECEPLIFQLSEYAENAGRRVVNIADATVGGFLKTRLADPYYSSSTMYRLIAPSACFVMMRQKLTVVDLRLSPRINGLYGIAKLHYTVLLADFEMSSIDERLDYLPHRPEAEEHRKSRVPDPSKYWHQALVWGNLDRAASALLVRNDGGEIRRIMGFGEFDEQLQLPGSEIQRSFDPIRVLFEEFDPKRRPVLWRVLTGLAILTQMFRVETSIAHGDDDVSRKPDVKTLFHANDAANIEAAAGPGVGNPLQSAAEWIARQLTVPPAKPPAAKPPAT